MTNDVETTLDIPTTEIVAPPLRQPLAHRPDTLPAAPPSVEQILMTAVERGIDPAGMEKLAAIYEREVARRAEAAFNAAMTAFRAEVPAIIKNRDAVDPEKNRIMYSYADLSEITKIVDPLLHKNGLSYQWDSEVDEGQTLVTCTILHIEGHKRASRFACKGSGTRRMNDAQVAASAVTFGRRYSLVLALGLCVDDDDDARRAAPMPQPAPFPDAPKVAPRAERVPEEQPQPPDDGTPRVRAADLSDLCNRWRAKTGKPQGTITEFMTWARGVLHVGPEVNLTYANHWSLDGLEVCRQALEESK